MKSIIKNKNLSFSILCFIILIIKFVANFDFQPDYPYVNGIVPYVLSYKYSGFGTRMLLGSIISLFTNYISIQQIYFISFIMHIAFFVIFSVILYFTLNKTIHDNQSKLHCIVLLLILFPYCAMMGGRFILFTDEIMLLFALISLIIIYNVSFKYMFIVIFSIAFGLLIHTTFVFMFLPLIIICLLYKLMIISSINCKQVILYIALFVTIVISIFIYLFFFSKNHINIEELVNVIETHTDYGNHQGVLDFFNFEYNMSLIERFNSSTLVIYSNPNILIQLVLTIILDLIVYMNFVKVYYCAYKIANNYHRKVIYLLSILVYFSFLPLIIGCDIKRWLDAAMISQFLLLIFYIINNDECITKAISNCILNSNKYYYYFVLVLFAIFNIDNNLFFNGLIGKFCSMAKLILCGQVIR